MGQEKGALVWDGVACGTELRGAMRTQNTSEGWGNLGSFMDVNMVQGEPGGV